jgi:filamentous hemagglutinin family protein
MSLLAFDCACVGVNTRSRRKAFDKTLLLSAAAIAMVASPSAHANPVGGAVTTGLASVSTSSNKTNVNQKSEDVVVDWSSFNIGAGQTTQFVQPNAQAIAVNRICGANASQILGTLDANGRVVLINGNGVLFGKGAQVNVGSLIATSTDGSDSDVLSGKFTHAGKQTASVINNGVINAASGGTVALVAPNVTNTGTVNAKLGTVALGAANKFTVDFAGDGLLSFAAQGDVNARASAINSGLLSGANVSMTAHAANGIATGIVNMSGIVTAQGVQNVGGTIVLDGGLGGSINIGGKLDASGAKSGGSIIVGGWNDAAVTVNKSAVLNASATAAGDGGHISVIAQKNSFAGSAEARGGILGGNGGSIETSGDSLDFIGSHVNAGASVGHSGTWLLDPSNEIIDANGAIAVNIALQFESVEFLTNATSCGSWGSCVPGAGDIDITGHISWNNSNTLTIDAWNSINILAPITANGAGSVVISYNNGGGSGTLNFGLGPTGFAGNIQFADIDSGTVLGNLSIQGAGYTLIADKAQLEAIGGTPSNNFALADSFDASGGDFTPIGVPYLATFEGLGNTISNLTINVSTGNVGLFTQVGQSGGGGGTVRDLGLQGESATGNFPSLSLQDVGGLAGINYGTIIDSYTTGAASGGGGGLYVGGLVGENFGAIGGSHAAVSVNGSGGYNQVGGLVGDQEGTLSDSFATGAVSGTGGNSEVGGLVGVNQGATSGSYATGAVSSDTGANYVGGLVGQNIASITDSYATGAVSGDGGADIAGGLVGDNAASATISTSYATGIVNSDFSVGGLVGEEDNEGGVASSYWDMQTSGIGASSGAGNIANDTGITGMTTSALQAALPSGFSSSTWSILPGTSYPYLSWQFSGTPQVLSGYAFNGHGTNALNAGTVTVDAYGNAFATLTTGANGHFYDLVAPGTLVSDEPLLAYTTGPNNGAHVEQYFGNATGFDIWGNTLIAPTADTTYSSASGTSLQTQDAALIAFVADSDSNASFITGLTNFGYVGTGASFTLDQSLSPANGLFVETRNGDLTVADPITLAGTNGLTLYSSNALTIDAPINVTGAGAVALAAAYDTTTVPGTPLLELSFGLGPNGFAGSLNYAKGSGEGISGQSLSINGTSYTLLYSMSDVDSIACSYAPTTCVNPNAENLAGSYALADSLDAAGFGYIAIGVGVPGDGYSGMFEGLGHTISNLSFDNVNPPAGQGLFSGSSGSIRDIGMVGGSIGGSGENGFLVGVDSGVIENTFETGTVQSYTGADPTQFGGGLVGMVASTGVVANSFATGHITDSYSNIGGLVGDLQGTLVNDYATISIVGSAGGISILGGLVGEADSGSRIEDSYATGAVTTSGSSQKIGGLVGYLDGGSISDSFATGAVSGSSFVGGLVGESEEGAIANSYATGSVHGTSGVGGLVGALFDPSSSVTDSFSIGMVTGSSHEGGLVGQQSDSGGVTDSYWDTQTSGIGTDNAGALPLTTAQIQGKFANMTGFAGPTWATGTGLFPYLSWQFSGTPQAISGIAYSNGGGSVLQGGTVSGLLDGNALGTASTGANGYYYLLAAPGTISAGNHALLVDSSANGVRVDTTTDALDANNNVSFFDVWGNTLIAPTSDTTYSTASATSLQTQDSALIAQAVGANTDPTAGLTNYGYIATGSGFTIDQSISPANGLYVETRNGNLTVTDPITLAGANGLTLISSNALTIDAPIAITGAGALTLDYSTSALANLSFGLTSSGFTGGVNYGSTNNGGTLTIDGATYTLLYSMTDLQDVNNALTGNYALATSLDAFSVSSWTPLGTDSSGGVLNSNNGFSGAFEGLGNTVSNLTMNGTNNGTIEGAGLFGDSAFGSIRDIGLSGISIISSKSDIGGLVGLDGNASTASNGSTIADSYVTGSVSGFGAVGGLVGKDGGGAIDGSYTTAAVNASLGAGGLVGEFLGGTITESYATRAVTGLSQIGGLVGRGYGTISASYAAGAVTVIDNGAGNAGGFIGAGGPVTISDSYATGAVNGGAGGERIGGFAGSLSSGTIATSYSTGAVSGGTMVGGFVGEDYTTGGITNSDWDMDTSGFGASAGAGNISNDSGITGIHTTTLQGALPGGFSNATWSTGTGLYPYLSWQFNGTPQAISGTVFSGSTALAGENVGLLVDGSAVSPAITEGSGANGYYYLLLAPGTVSGSGSDVVTYLTSGTPANTFVQSATGSLSGVDLFENTFVAASSASDSAAILAAIPAALGSASGPQFLYTASSGIVPGINLAIYDNSSAFTLDSSIDVGDATLELYTTGSDTQTSGTLTANKLRSNSTGGLSLTGANSISELGIVLNAGAGGIAVTDAQALTVAGNLSTGTGEIHLTTTGSGNGILIDNHLVGGTVDLVSADSIRESGTNGFIHASVLEGSSDGLAFFNGANKIDALNDFSTGGAGAFSLYDWKTLDETGLINTGKHSITLDTQIGDLDIGGALIGGTISLTSVAGDVQGAGIIDANVLNVSADTGIDLYGSNNDIKSVGTDTTNSGPNVINMN